MQKLKQAIYYVRRAHYTIRARKKLVNNPIHMICVCECVCLYKAVLVHGPCNMVECVFLWKKVKHFKKFDGVTPGDE